MKIQKETINGVQYETISYTNQQTEEQKKAYKEKNNK